MQRRRSRRGRGRRGRRWRGRRRRRGSGLLRPWIKVSWRWVRTKSSWTKTDNKGNLASSSY